MRKAHNLVCGISGGLFFYFLNYVLDKFLRVKDLFSANEMREMLLSMC